MTIKRHREIIYFKNNGLLELQNQCVMLVVTTTTKTHQIYWHGQVKRRSVGRSMA